MHLCDISVNYKRREATNMKRYGVRNLKTFSIKIENLSSQWSNLFGFQGTEVCIRGLVLVVQCFDKKCIGRRHRNRARVCTIIYVHQRKWRFLLILPGCAESQCILWGKRLDKRQKHWPLKLCNFEKEKIYHQSVSYLHGTKETFVSVVLYKRCMNQ